MNDRIGLQSLHGERIAPPRHLEPVEVQERQSARAGDAKKDNEKRKR